MKVNIRRENRVEIATFREWELGVKMVEIKFVILLLILLYCLTY